MVHIINKTGFVRFSIRIGVSATYTTKEDLSQDMAKY